jgi:hypothetical protein
VRTCERCGRYACTPCVSHGGRCGDCIRQYVARVPSSKDRARRAARFLRFSGAVGLCNLLLYLWSIYFWAVLFVPGSSEYLKIMRALEPIGMIVYGAAWVLSRITPILCWMWLHRVVRQIGAWGGDVGATPAWAVGCWLVPFVNLVKPFRVVRGIVEELGGKSLAASLRLGMWWFAFMLALVLNWLAESLSMRLMPPPLAITVSLIKVGFLIYIIPVAFHCVRIVREIQERLDARRSGL